MRHRATRPLFGYLLGLPRATARGLGLAPGPARARVLGLLVAVLAVAGGGYAVVASVVGDDRPSPQAGPSGSPEPSEVAEPPGSGRPTLTEATSPTGRPNPTRTPEDPEPATSRGAGAASPTTSAVSPSAAESDSTQPPGAIRSATPGPRLVTSTATEDVDSPDTTVSYDVTGPGEVLLTFAADETATFACSLDGAAYSACRSPQGYADLHPGWHTFDVRATDAAGNVDATPAGTRWLSTNGSPGGDGDQ